MPPENLLTRLAKTASVRDCTRMRAEILHRIDGGLFKRVVTQHSINEAKLKNQVLSRIAHRKTVHALKDIRKLVSPSLVRIMELRAELLDRIANWQPIPVPLWQRALKPIAVMAAFSLVLRILPTLFIATPIQASSENLLLPTQGSVSITDGAEWSVIEGELTLDHPVTIRTGPESAATIIVKDAVLRLGENTEATLSDAAFKTEISGPIARIAYGQTWIASFLPEALFAGTSVTLPQGLLALKEGSASVLADPQQSTVQVFHRFARVLPTGEEPIHLIQGDQLALLPDGKTQRHLITQAMRSGSWVQENLSRDAVHRTEVVKKKQENATTMAGILPDSAFYFLKIASEQIDLGLTLSGKSRQEKKLHHAETRLNEAVALLKSGKKEEAQQPLLAYREAILALASVSEEEARALLGNSLVSSSTTVADALPHSDLFAAKETILAVAVESQAAEIGPDDVDLYLLSDALLEIESLIAQGSISDAAAAWNGIEGAIASVIEEQRLGEIAIGKDSFKAIKTILRAATLSLTDAEEFAQAEEVPLLADLKQRLDNLSPVPAPAATVTTAKAVTTICMSVREVTRRTNQFLAAVYTYQTPVGQRNAVLQQIASLPDCPQSGRILSKVMNKVPVFTRSFVWEALQKTGSET